MVDDRKIGSSLSQRRIVVFSIFSIVIPALIAIFFATFIMAKTRMNPGISFDPTPFLSASDYISLTLQIYKIETFSVFVFLLLSLWIAKLHKLPIIVLLSGLGSLSFVSVLAYAKYGYAW
jgi:hypothetical protein